MSKTDVVDCHSIGLLSARYGVSSRTLRFYEEIGLLSPDKEGQQRVYRDREIVRLEVILLAKRFGFTLGEIKDLIDSRPARQTAPGSVFDLGLSKTEIESRLKSLSRQKAQIVQAIEDLRSAAVLGGSDEIR